MKILLLAGEQSGKIYADEIAAARKGVEVRGYGDYGFEIISTGITFNKTMYEQSIADTYGDLYQLVRDYKWTFDTMYEMAKMVTADTDGEGGMTAADTFGMSSSNGDARNYYIASGQSLIRKNADDLPELYIGSNEASISTAQKILQKMAEGDTWMLNCQSYKDQVPDIWVLSLQIFGENRALFRTTAFSAIKNLRAYTDASDFGIVPTPLITEGQDKYYTPAACDYAYGIWCVIDDVPGHCRPDESGSAGDDDAVHEIILGETWFCVFCIIG